MKRLIPALIVLGVFIGNAGESYALPPCPGSPALFYSSTVSWTDCYGVWTQNTGTNAGLKYVGEWKGGKRHGQGTLTLSTPHKRAGLKYVGEWKYGKRNGQGTFISANGRVLEGIFENGKFRYAGTSYWYFIINHNFIEPNSQNSF